MLTQAHDGSAGDGASAAAADSGVAAQRGSCLVTVDDFDLLRTPSGRKRRDDLEVNLLRTGLRRLCTVMEAFKVPAVTDLLRQGADFDFVYVAPSQDGSGVLLGAALAWRMVAQGGIVLIDSCGAAWVSDQGASLVPPFFGCTSIGMMKHRTDRFSVPPFLSNSN